MSTSDWGAVVSFAFAVVLTVTPIPEKWRSVVVFAAWFLFLYACIGWGLSHSEAIRKFRSAPEGTRPMILIIIAVIGASLAVGAWLLIPSLSSTRESNAPTSPPAAEPTVTAFKMKYAKGVEIHDNVFENVPGMAFAKAEHTEDLHIWNNRVTNPPLPNANQSQGKPELSATWITLLTKRTLGEPKGAGIMPLGSFIGVQLAIANNGSPSTAGKFQLHVRSPSFKSDLFPFGVKEPLKIRDEKGHVAQVIPASETLPIKSLSGIGQGQPPMTGWLLYHIPQIDISALGDKLELAISFEDQTGREYSVSIVANK
jgi:hypothetical protein